MELHTTLLLLAALLVAVSLIQPLARRLGLPTSVLLAMVGIGTGVTALVVMRSGASGPLASVAQALTHLPVDSDVFLSVFLPLLLFRMALGIEVRRLVEDAAPILLLAVVAVVVATFMIGAALAPIAGVAPAACYMLGAIVATTDPVAVIGIFHDVGAPARLSRLVEGESLLNDAAAITLFTVLIDMLTEGRATGAGAATATFLWSFLGGIAVGYVGARVFVALLSGLRDLRLAQVTLTLALPYVVFMISERQLEVSGVVAAVTAGLVTNALGQAHMAPDDWRFLHDVWEQLDFWASSLIFILASLLIPELLLNVGWRDALLLGVLVLAALASRALVLFGLLPVLTRLRLSQRVDYRFKIVIIWGGLRGAVTLALALAVTENAAVTPDVQRFVAVLATGFVLFTLVVKATTLRPLIRLLGLDRLSPVDEALRNQVLALSHGRVAGAVRATGERYHFASALIGEVAAPIGDRVGPRTEALARQPRASDAQASHDLLLALVALSTRERELILEQFAARTVGGRVVEEMLADVGRLIDRVRARGAAEYLAGAERLVGFSRPFRLAHALHRRLHIDAPLVDRLADRFERLLVSRIVLDELVSYVPGTIVPLLGDTVAAPVHDLLQRRQQMTDAALEALRAQYPDYAARLERRLLTKVALRREDLEHRALFEEGVIGPELYSVLRRDLQSARARADVRPTLDLGLEARTLIGQVPLFGTLSARDLDAVARLLRPRFAVPGEELILRGQHGRAMFFIASGRVSVHVGHRTVELGRGDFFGEMALVSAQLRQADVLAESYCQLLELRTDDFHRLLRGNPRIKAQIDRIAADRRQANEKAEADQGPAATPS